MIIEPIKIQLKLPNYKWFESKGYEIKKRSNKNGKLVLDIPQIIEVKFCDIPQNSHEQVEIICDCCGKKESKTVRAINEYKAKYNKDCCSDCVKKHKIEHIIQTKIDKYGTTNVDTICNIIGVKSGRKVKYTYGDILNVANQKGYAVLDDMPIDSCVVVSSHIKCRCIKHNNIFNAPVDSLMKFDKHNCQICKNECIGNTNRKSSIDEAKKICLLKGYMILTDSINNCDDEICYICNNHSFAGVQKTSLYGLKNYHTNCRYCKAPSGKAHFNWQGGVSNIKEYLREQINEWKHDSFKKYNYKCDITNTENDLIIHHLYNFSDIVDETIKECGLSVKTQVKDYTEEELSMLSKKCLELHYKYGLGVCLTSEIHKRFHSLYGINNNTIDQYNEFKQKCLNHEIII